MGARMIPSFRYALAVVVIMLLPIAAYRLASQHFGVLGSLLASAAPLLVWLLIDLMRFRHLDALSATTLLGIVFSTVVLATRPAQWLLDMREPLVSGLIGALFLLSLLLRRPLVFWLARSTMSREHQGAETDFDIRWHDRPTLRRSIRLMTLVWGLGLIGENLLRLWVAAAPGVQTHWKSTWIGYVVYGALPVWTILYRRLFIERRQAEEESNLCDA
jgi:hypothetical protein